MEKEPQFKDKETEPRADSRVWVVEDDQSFSKVIEAVISNNDQVFNSGSQFVNAFKEALESGSLPDFILLDYNLNEADDPSYPTGVEVLNEIDQLMEDSGNSLDYPVILAHSSDRTFADKLIEAGADRSISKPGGTIKFLKNPSNYDQFASDSL